MWITLSVVQIESLFAVTDLQEKLKVNRHPWTVTAPLDAGVSCNFLRCFLFLLVRNEVIHHRLQLGVVIGWCVSNFLSNLSNFGN